MTQSIGRIRTDDDRGRTSANRRTAVISANESWNLVNFRKPIIRALIRAGWRVVAVVPVDEATPALQRLGVEVEPLGMDARGVSPVRDLLLLTRYWRILGRLKADLFLGFTVKPNIFGSIAASRRGIPMINTVSGLGTGFLSGKLLESFVSRLYRAAFRRSHRVIFHNSEDRDLFVDRGLVRADRAIVVSGSGVDLNEFAPRPAPKNALPVFLFIGRCLKDKGLEEFLAAARDMGSKAIFQVVGAVEDHPKAASRDLIDRTVSAGHVRMLGPVGDVRPLIAAADCVVLPSYREGLPRSLMEAAAMAKPVITTDVAGCRDVVDPGSTGFICEARSATALANALRTFLETPPRARSAMGDRAREKAVREFSEDGVVSAYLDAVDEIRVTRSSDGAMLAAE